jgi:hypothetical protein
MKDLFNNSRPVQIEIGEWWFNGRFIQKQVHPLLSPYVSFNDNEDGCMVETHTTFKEATKYCLDNPCNTPQHQPKDFISSFKN